MVAGVVLGLFAIASVYDYVFVPDALRLSEVEERMKVEFPEGLS